MSTLDLPNSHVVEVNGSDMHYIDQGRGDPILFLHGMPTSSYVWRKIIPHLSTLGRCIAPDLIGMGKSAKPDIAYTIVDHIHYIEKFIEQLRLKKITLVMHGWGSVIGFDYAMHHEKNCKGLVCYEGYVSPIHEDDISLPLQEQILSLKKQEHLHEAITDSPYFIDAVLPQSRIKPLSKEELSYYRTPYLQKGSGKVLLQYLNELPTGDQQTKADKIIAAYSKKLLHSKVPKLLLYSMPGFITPIKTVMWAKQNFSNLEIIDVGEELHYAQETNPNAMSEMISAWLQAVEPLMENP